MNKSPLADFRLLLYLFIGLRLTLAVVYQPYNFELYEEDGTPTLAERGLTSFGDYRYFYRLAEMTSEGDLPYRDFWYEFPPVWPLLFTGLYALAGADYASWATLLGLVLVVFDVGNLLLLRRLGRRLHGEAVGDALPWFYALLAAPVVFPWWNFEPLVLFLLLLAVWWLLEGRALHSAAATALGVLTKFLGVLLLPTVWRFYDRRLALRYTVLVVLVVALVLGALVAWGGRMAVASLLAQFNKASYQSVWALLDGNLRTGRFVSPGERFVTDTAYEPVGNDAVLPGWLRLIPFAALGLFIYTRRLRRDDQGILAFFSVTVVLFFLWSQGWSPQWALTLSPLILLNFPDRVGVLLCLLIAFGSFVEYPALFARTAASEGEITGTLLPSFALIVVMRTLVLAGLAAALYQRLTGQEEAQLEPT